MPRSCGHLHGLHERASELQRARAISGCFEMEPSNLPVWISRQEIVNVTVEHREALPRSGELISSPRSGLGARIEYYRYVPSSLEHLSSVLPALL